MDDHYLLREHSENENEAVFGILNSVLIQNITFIGIVEGRSSGPQFFMISMIDYFPPILFK